MSYTLQTTLWCDEEGCDASHCSDSGGPTSARVDARLAGWSWRSGFDFCPAHSGSQDGGS